MGEFFEGLGMGIVLGLAWAGTVGFAVARWLKSSRDGYRRLFLRAAGEIGRERGRK